MLVSLILAFLGIGVTVYIFFLQKQKIDLKVEVIVDEKPLEENTDPRAQISYENNEGEKIIELSLKVINTDSKPIKAGAFMIGVPKYQKLHPLNFIFINNPTIKNIPLLDKTNVTNLLPGDKTKEVQTTGYNVSKRLKEKGFSGNLSIVFGVFDENKNCYYSKPLQINLEEWQKDRGQFISGIFPLGG